MFVSPTTSKNRDVDFAFKAPAGLAKTFVEISGVAMSVPTGKAL
ncbi:MAG: hypothetical protein AB2693_32430 [Candidatus Thiodiazotropha sp.]